MRYGLAGFGRDAAARATAAQAGTASSGARYVWLAARLTVVRRGDAAPGRLPVVKTSADASALVHQILPQLARDPQENAGVVCLDVRKQVIAVAHVYRGTLESVDAGTSNILRPVLLVPAVSFIKFHTHPSGDPTPSGRDLADTRGLVRAARLVGLHCLDHVVLTDAAEKFVSIRETHPELWRE